MIKTFDPIRLFILGILGVFFYFSCNDDKVKNIPDVSHIQIDLNIKHFERDLFIIDTNYMEKGLENLKSDYPVFLNEVFLGRILPVLQDTNSLRLFLTSPGILKLRDTLQEVYGGFQEEKMALEQMFKYYKHYFPERKIPTVITFLSEFTLGNFTYEDEILGIGLDFFLGAEYPNYDPAFFPKYIRRSMNKEHLIAKATETLANDIAGQAMGDRMLDMMVHNGKVLYIMDALLPHVSDSIKLNYTAEQMSWCNEHEVQMWTYFLGEDLLYSTDRKNIRKLVDHSPHSPGMPDEAPGRTANFIGWKIVQNYMKRNPDINIKDLIETNDAQEILEKSRYRPRD